MTFRELLEMWLIAAAVVIAVVAVAFVMAAFSSDGMTVFVNDHKYTVKIGGK